MGDKKYKVGSTTYDIPEAETQAFLKDFPDAVELETFIVDKDTFDIPIKERDAFLADFPTAKPLKKKDISEVSGTPSETSSQEQPPLNLATPDLTLETPPFTKAGEGVKQEKPTAKTFGEIVNASGGALNSAFAGLMNTIDRAQTITEDALTQVFFGKEAVSDVKKLRQSGIDVGELVTGKPTRPFKMVSDLLEEANRRGGVKELPSGVGGDIIKGVTGVIPDIMATVFVPEIKTAQLLSKAGVKAMSKFGVVLGTEGAISGAETAEEGTTTQKLTLPVFGALQGYMNGWMFDNLGAMSSKIGGRIADRLVPQVKSINQAVDKALVQHTATSLTNATFFGTYGNMDEYIRTGSISLDTFATNAGMGLALGLRETGKLLWAKGLTSLTSAPREMVNNAIKSETSVEELAGKAQEKIDLVESGQSKDVESDVVSATMLAKTAELKAMIDEVRDNPKEVIKSIEESTLEPKAQEVVIDKINEIVADNDPKVQESKKYTDDIELLDQALDKIKKNKALSNPIKKAESEPLNRKKAELEQKVLEIYGKAEPKKEGEEKKTEKPLTKEDKAKIKEVLKPEEEPNKIAVETKAIEDWLKSEGEDFISVDWDGEFVEIFKSRDEKPEEYTRDELIEKGVDFPQEIIEPKQEIGGIENAIERRETNQEVSDERRTEGGVGQMEGVPVRDVSQDKGGTQEKTGEEVKRNYVNKNNIESWSVDNPGVKDKFTSPDDTWMIIKDNNTDKTYYRNNTSRKEYSGDLNEVSFGTLDKAFQVAQDAVNKERMGRERAEENKTPLIQVIKDKIGDYRERIYHASLDELNGIVKALDGELRGRVSEDTVKDIYSMRNSLQKKELTPPKPEILPEEVKPTEGIKYGDKTYQSVEQLQDDYDLFPDFQTYNKVLNDVRKFEDGLRVEAGKRSKASGEKLNLLTDDTGKKTKKRNKELEKLSLKFFPIDISRANTALWKQLVKVRDTASDWIARNLQAGETSRNDALRWVSKAITNLYGGLGRTESDILGKLKLLGTTKEFAPYEANNIQGKLREIVNGDAESLRRVRDVLDPDIATEQLTYGDLTPQEQAVHDALKELNTWVHETNYAGGFIPTDVYLKFKNPDGSVKYFARMYDTYETPSEIETYIKAGNNATQHKLNVDIFKARKEIDDWKKEHAITDPIYITAKRVMQTIQNDAIKKYMDQVIAEHPDFIREVKAGEETPKGFTKLSKSRRWGELRDKAVANHIVEDFTGFFYANNLADATYDMLKMWDRTKINQFYKKWHTVYNPFVQTGNFTGNLFFSSIAGINPVVLISKMGEASRDSKAGTDEYKSVLKSGILGATGITGDLTPINLLNKNTVNNVTKSQGYLKKAVDIFTKADEGAQKLYQGTDNLAKYAAYKVFIDQGLSHEQAIRRVYDAFQNYATVGKTWDVASKTPIFGNKFIKFQADLQRILLNGITTNPMTTVGTLALISMLGATMSKLSGESDEEKKVRESRKGVAKIPLPFGASVPLSFKVGKKELNFARYLSPLYLYRYGDSETDLAELSRFLPFQFQKIEKPQKGERGNALSFGDPTFGWIASIMADRDFRGISIQNPQATKYFNPNPTTDERIANVMNYVARSQLPFYKSAQDIYDGIVGNLDYYGRKRTWSDAILNNLIKIQEFDKPELKRYVEGNIGYLTNRFAAMSEAMGNSNSAFLKEINRAKEQGLSESVLDKVYEEQDRIRAKRIKQSLDQQVPILQEIERLTNVYKRWYPDDQFIQDNFADIESGKTRRFEVMNEIDLQKKYKEEYFLIKNNKLLRKPQVPDYYNKKSLTEEQKKEWVNIYWSEYVRNLDRYIGLTQEEIDEQAGKTARKVRATKTEPEYEITNLQEKASKSASKAKEEADRHLRNIVKSDNE